MPKTVILECDVWYGTCYLIESYCKTFVAYAHEGEFLYLMFVLSSMEPFF